MENFDAINTRRIKKTDAMKFAVEAEENRNFHKTLDGMTVGLSTGTSGNKGIFLVSEKERAKWVAVVLHRVLGFSIHKRKIAFFLRANSRLYESANSVFLKFQFFDLLHPHEQNFSRLIDFQADILVAQPSALLKIATSYKEAGLTPRFRKIISVAEVLDSMDRAKLENVFGMPIDEVYQCTEGFLACTCRLGKLHLNEDFLIVEKEYIDKEKKRYFPVITDLQRRTQPVVRYRLDDILIEGECPCGSRFAVIDQVEGRADDIIRLFDIAGKPVDIFPDYLRRAIIVSADEIVEYEITQSGQDQVEIFFVTTQPGERIIHEKKITENLNRLFRRFNIENVTIRFLNASKSAKDLKLRRVRNEYYKRD